MSDPTAHANVGTIVAVRGSVIDVRFDEQLPPINSLLHIGTDEKVGIEVWAQLGVNRVRAIALTPTQGVARGMAVASTGGPLKVPVGKAIRSRMFDVFGHTIDRGAALTDLEWRSVHQLPPPLVQRSTKSELFEIGIKVINVLMPLERITEAQRVLCDVTAQIPADLPQRCLESAKLGNADRDAVL